MALEVTSSVAIRRVVTVDWRGMQPLRTARMVITPEDDSTTAMFIPYSPSEIEHSGIGSDYATIDRTGRVPALVYRNKQLAKMSMTLLIADRTLFSAPIAGTFKVLMPAITALTTLQRYAELGTRLRVTYGAFENGLWRITSFTINSKRRDPATNEMTSAEVDIEFTKASDIIIGVGPVTGGVTPPPATTPPAAPPQTRTYTVKSGDTLWAISVKYYGTGTKWTTIADANGVTDPRKLQIGKVLRIP